MDLGHTSTALEKWYQFLRWLMPTIEKFPRTYKFTIGDRLLTGALDVLDGLIAATYSKNPQTLLMAVNLGLEKLRFMMRLAFDARFVDMRRYEFASRAINEVGKMVGAWIKVKASHAQTS